MKGCLLVLNTIEIGGRSVELEMAWINLLPTDYSWFEHFNIFREI